MARTLRLPVLLLLLSIFALQQQSSALFLKKLSFQEDGGDEVAAKEEKKNLFDNKLIKFFDKIEEKKEKFDKKLEKVWTKLSDKFWNLFEDKEKSKTLVDEVIEKIEEKKEKFEDKLFEKSMDKNEDYDAEKSFGLKKEFEDLPYEKSDKSALKKQKTNNLANLPPEELLYELGGASPKEQLALLKKILPALPPDAIANLLPKLLDALEPEVFAKVLPLIPAKALKIEEKQSAAGPCGYRKAQTLKLQPYYAPKEYTYYENFDDDDEYVIT